MYLRILLWLGVWASVAFHPAHEPEKPTNIILVIADGMGLAHISLAEFLNRPSTVLAQMPVVGLQKTHSASHLITDSGAAGTAMSCGVKTFNSGIGVDQDSVPVETILEWAGDQGFKTGFAVTSSVVHATPAAFYAHVFSRGSYEEIARQLTYSDIDVFVGGGERYFVDRYMDDVNLVSELKKRNYEVISSYDPQGKFKLDNVRQEKRIACFTAFEDPERASQGRSYFPWVVRRTMTALEKRSDQGYLLMVEASQIDWAAHANDVDWLIYEMQDLYDMLELVFDKIVEDQNTLLIVTSDHECGYMSLRGKRFPSVDFNTKVHSCQMVPVFAAGPGAEEFAGIYDNTEIFTKLKYLMQ
jgi:alkaline phosphatase